MEPIADSSGAGRKPPAQGQARLLQLLPAGAREWLDRRSIALLVEAKLRGLAALLRLPRYAHLLRPVPAPGGPRDPGANGTDRNPINASADFAAVIEIVTRDDSARLHVVLERGRMRVVGGPATTPEVVLRFRTGDDLRGFFADRDLFHMLLSNQVEFDGNLACLARFGHVITAVRARGRRRVGAARPPAPSWPELVAPPSGSPAVESPPGESTALADPYLAAYTLDDFPRIKRLLWAHRHVAPEICTERPRLLTEFKRGHRPAPGETPGLRQAGALRHILEHKRPIVNDDDLLAGTTTSRRVGVVIYPELGGTAIWPELLTVEARPLNPYRIAPDDIEILARDVLPFWTDDNVREWTRRHFADPESLALDGRFALYFLWKNYAVSHTVADFPGVLGRGLDAIAAEAAGREQACSEPDRCAFYRSLQVAVEGVLAYAGHLAEHAARLARTLPGRDPDAIARRAELHELSRICAKVPARPADSLHEALQAVWLLHLCLHQENMNAGLSLGRLDLWLQPYLARDLAGVGSDDARRVVIERALELTCGFMLKLTDHLPLAPDIANRLFGGSSSDQAITLGGVDGDGGSAVCDMTWIFLKATEMLRLRDPNMNARFAPGKNSAAYLRRLCEVNLLTRATPSIHNDAAMVPVLEGQGFSPAEARDWAATGCVEPTISGRHFGHTGSLMLNLVAPLEMALRDGVHPLLDRRVGPATGDPRAMTSYADFLAAYQAQLSALIDKMVDANEKLGRAHQALHPSPLLSALFQGPMHSGRDLIDGGAPHNSTGVANIGLADVVDSLCAIRTLVFERRRVDFATLLQALADDFVGHDKLLAEILARCPKFGQGDSIAGEVASELVDFVFAELQARSHYRGGRYQPGYWSMSNHVAFGILSGALPSGRRRGKPFTPGLTPSPLCGASLTEQMRAVAGLDPSRMPNNLAFNIKVVPGGDDDARRVVDRMVAYLEGYFDLGGMQLQFNVMSSALLREAMDHPEAHRDLLVRISGYNAYFVELNRDMQLELIDRMEHSLG